MTADVAALLQEALAAVRESGMACAVMGGCARNAYAEPRATKDVDLVVEVAEANHPALVRNLERRGFRSATSVGGEGGVPDLTLFRDDRGRRIDLLFAHTDFEREALRRAVTREPFRGLSATVITVEDLIIYKVLADRPQDRVDVRDVVGATRARGQDIDWDYVEGWCDAWEVRGRLDRIRRELAE